jgi:MATE family multidrug resistance protein
MVRLAFWAGIPFGIWLAFRRNMGLHGLWYGLTLSLVYGSVISVSIGLRANWNKEVEKVQKRLAEAKADQDGYGAPTNAGERVLV